MSIWISANNYILFSLVFGAVLFQHATSQLSNQQYINKKMVETKEKMVRSYFENALRDSQRTYEATWNKNFSKKVDIEPRTVNIFGKTFIFMNNRMFSISGNTGTIMEVSEINQEIPVNFVKSYTWKKELFFIICQPVEHCNLFTANSNLHLTSRQIFRYTGSPMDACFFSKKNQLHLIVVNNAGRHQTNSVIYRWTGTHMEVVTTIQTTGAVGVTTFRSQRSSIIAIAQNIEDQPRVDSIVYEFKDNNIELLQFLHTDGATAVHHYRKAGEDFVLVEYQSKLGEIFWWDGKELIKWMSLLDTLSLRMVKSVNIHGELFLILCKSNSLHICKFEESKCTVANGVMAVNDTIIDLEVWSDDTTINIILVTIDENNSYNIESWNINLTKNYIESSLKYIDLTTRCMKELQGILNQRMLKIENLRKNGSHRFNSSFTKNYRSSPVDFQNLIIDNATIQTLQLSSNNEPQIPDPDQILNMFQELQINVDSLHTESMKTLKENDTNILTGKVIIDGDATFDELTIDSLNIKTLNNRKVDFNNVLWMSQDQHFSTPLKGRTIVIHNLEIPMLCGLSSEYWLLENDSEKTGFTELPSIYVSGGSDSITIKSDLTLNVLKTKKLNGIDLKYFFNDIFISGSRQNIKGNITYKGWLQVVSLNTDILNGVPSNNLLTKSTNQKLGNAFVTSLQTEHLFVERINGIYINDTARVSTENVIKGKVILANLIINDELFVDSNLTSSLSPPIQIYDEVNIIGDIFIKDLNLEPHASMNLNNVERNVQSLLENSWSKSNQQNILSPVKLEGGLTIDELVCPHLNGIAPDDFLYTDTKEITSDFSSILFTNFHFKRLVDERGNNELHVEETPESIIVRQKLRIKSLVVDNLFLEKFNRIPINAMSNGNSVRFLGTSFYDTLEVLERAEVDNIETAYVNDRDASIFRNALKVEDNINVNNLKTNLINVRDLHVHTINGKYLSYFSKTPSWKNSSYDINIIVAGGLEVEGNMDVAVINGKYAQDYLQSPNLNRFPDKIETIDELRVTDNLIVKSLNGVKVENIFRNALSRSEPQKITGEFTFVNLNTKKLLSKRINGKDSSHLIFVDEPFLINGNVTFSSLSVNGDISDVQTVNGYTVKKLSDELQKIPTTYIGNLIVDGDITWQDTSNELNSLSYIFKYSVLKNEHQVISQPTTFRGDVYIDSFINTFSDVIDNVNIPNIVSDAVIADQSTNSIIIGGIKTFKNKISIQDLKVTSDIGIAIVNDLNIVDLDKSIIRKYRNETIFGETIFLQDVIIKKLITSGGITEIPAFKHTFSRYEMPNMVHFEHLIVRNNVSLYSLDGVDFDDFVRSRITLNQNHDVFGDLQFTESATILDKSFIWSVNGIDPENFVISGLDNISQSINGTKIFSEDIVIAGNVNVDLLNDIDLKKEFRNSIFNHDNVNIFGNFIFEDLEVSGVVNITGRVNGFHPKNLLREISVLYKSTLDSLKSTNETIERINTANSLRSYPVKFEYLEPEKYLKIHVPGVHKFLNSYDGSLTRFDLYGEQLGRFCNLPDDCLCRLQTVVEITKSMDWKIWRENNTVFAFNHQKETSEYTLKVVSETTSSSRQCTTPYREWASTKVFWEKTTDVVEKQVISKDLNTAGFISDAKTFMHDGKIVLILAIPYDSNIQSHETKSLVYELDLETNEILFSQALDTINAKALNVFDISKRGTHLLIGCELAGESLVYRLNPITHKFQMLRRLSSLKSERVASLIRADDVFLLLDHLGTKSLKIFVYNELFDNFYDYQTLHFESALTGLEVYYADYLLGESYVIVTTKSGWFYIYEYMFAAKFQLKMKYWMAGLRTLVPFNFLDRNYFFAGAATNSTIMRVVRQGAA